MLLEHSYFLYFYVNLKLKVKMTPKIIECMCLVIVILQRIYKNYISKKIVYKEVKIVIILSRYKIKVFLITFTLKLLNN